MASRPRLSADVRVERTVMPQIPAALRSKAVALTREALRVGEARAKRGAPVLTGFMRNNIEVEYSGGLDGRLWSRANYSGYVNFGTRFKGARPFFSEGVNAMRTFYLAGWKNIERDLPRLP